MTTQRTLTAVRTTGPITNQPFWRVVVTDGNASGLAFDRNLRAAVLRAGRVIGLVEGELEPSIDTEGPKQAEETLKSAGLVPTQSPGLYMQMVGRAKRDGSIEPLEEQCQHGGIYRKSFKAPRYE